MQKKLFNKYTAIAMTDKGLVRDHNEDSILVDEKLALLLVADGMGGHQAGEVASKEAIKVIQQMLDLQQGPKKGQTWLTQLIHRFKKEDIDISKKTNAIERALAEANHHIYQLNVERNAGGGSGMGTTIAGCQLISADSMVVFHIGDSRVYRCRRGKLEMLSKDHSAIQAWHDNDCMGDMPTSNIILRAVGPFSEVTADIQVVTIMKGDSFLICSDGLTDLVDDEAIEKVMQEVDARKLEVLSQKLLNMALEQGGRDNVSVIMLANNQ